MNKADKLPYEVKKITEYQLQRYRENRRELEEYKRDLIPSATPAYGSSGGGHGDDPRAAERVALRIMENTYVQQLGKAVRAVEIILDRLNETDLKLVELYYWKGKSAKACGIILGYDVASVHRHKNVILRAIAEELGLVERFCN